ncbi:MAG TPA: NAD(P)/FAD-dependent oxidoreductase [Acetobacteraceae bacterium]|nr:NAD(P)/FAD-dependent oxidoreductase [Acetobacteraceae bacterium]
MPETPTDTEVLVIGAGLAGLGAAAALRRLGTQSIVLEAANRIGGRAWTTHPPELGGVWFDMGAVWLHSAEHNPLVPIARAAGDTLLRSDELRHERLFVGTQEATPVGYADYRDSWGRFDAATDRLLRDLPDAPLSAVADHLPGDPWALTVEAWEGPVICVAEAEAFSLRDWRRNALEGSNLVPQGGIGAFVVRRLGEGLDIRLNAPVTRLRWNGPGGRVTAMTPRGALTAGAAIVTVSTGVLAADAIAFDPPLPLEARQCVDAMPMGLAMKVALRANGPDRLDLPLHCSVERQVARRGDRLVPFQCWPYGRDYVQGWIGGDVAWDLARTGDAAAVDFALERLRAIFGSRVDRLFRDGGHLVTHWEADPFIRGAYSWVRVGHADARVRLSRPLSDGHLLIAGEACHDGMAGTLAGAWLSGEQAAETATASVRWRP